MVNLDIPNVLLDQLLSSSLLKRANGTPTIKVTATTTDLLEARIDALVDLVLGLDWTWEKDGMNRMTMMFRIIAVVGTGQSRPVPFDLFRPGHLQ